MMNHRIFEQTALPHMTVLHNYALHLTLNPDNAKDLLQETYLKAFKFWSNFENGTNIKAWLYCIMKNSYINLYRKGIREPKKVEYQEHHLPYNPVQAMSFGKEHLPKKKYDEIFDDEITRSIESLKDTFRDMLILSDVEGLTYEEIAKVTHCPMGTVRSRLYRGRSLLRKKLLNYAKKNGYILEESCMHGLHENTHSTKNR